MIPNRLNRINIFPRNVPVQKVKEKKEGCLMKMERDSLGRVVKYRDNGLCSKEIKILKEQEETKDE